MRNAISVSRIWKGKAEKESDCYDKFVYLWFAFNSLYNQHFDAYRNSERDAIKNLVNDNKHCFSEQVASKLFNDSSVIYFQDRIIRDCKGTGRDTRQNSLKLRDPNSHRFEKVKALCMILYQVRCNLFHGNKMFGRDSDDIVVEQASLALAQIVDAFC